MPFYLGIGFRVYIYFTSLKIVNRLTQSLIMNPQEKYNMTWNSYTDHLREALSDLLSSNSFTDVTLICDDKKKISAHKIILSAFSPVFKDIFETDQNQKSIIYLKGIQSSEMESIVEFMYLGEATFLDDKVDDLLSVAKNLQIKQMCDTSVQNFYHKEKDLNIYESEWHVPTGEEGPTIEIIDEGKWKVPKVFCNETTREQEIDEGIDNKIKICNDHVSPKVSNGYQCPECKYTSNRKSNVRQHIRSIHEGKTYPCNFCSTVKTHPSHLITHVKRFHSIKTQV